MKTTKINIPRPCSFGWDNMALTENQKGRHCSSCNKIVVDFTKMTTDQLIDFLEKNKGTKVCGHFKTIDTTTPTWFQKPILNLYNHINNNYRLGVVKTLGLFAVSAMLTMTGCDESTDGEIADASCNRDSLSIVDSTKAITTDTTRVTQSPGKGN